MFWSPLDSSDWTPNSKYSFDDTFFSFVIFHVLHSSHSILFLILFYFIFYPPKSVFSSLLRFFFISYLFIKVGGRELLKPCTYLNMQVKLGLRYNDPLESDITSASLINTGQTNVMMYLR